MKKSKIKILLMLVIIGMFTVGMPILAYGANENLAIVKQADNSYIIYVKGYLNKEFHFAFSNDKNADVATLTFIDSAKDTANGENNIAYATDAITEKYIFVKTADKTEVFEIDINDNISKENLESINNVSKKIPVTLEQELVVDKVNEEGTKITETVGVAKVANTFKNGEYQLSSRKSTDNNNKLFALAELLEKNEFTDKYTKIKASKEFVDLKEKLETELKNEEWKKIDNNSISQPAEAQTGDQYILWLRGENKTDVHFLTSLRAYKEEEIEKEVKTILPYTYDNNTMLVIFAIVVVAIVLVSVRIAILKKKEMNK